MIKNSGLVKRAFKLKFGLELCVLTIAGMLAVTLFLYFVTSKDLGDSYGRAIYTIYDLKIRIFPLIFASFYSIFVLTLVTIAIALISVFFSHRIAGPIFRIEKSLELIGKGDLTVNTKFRGKDQLTGLADEINDMVRALNHSVRNSRDALFELQRCEERLEAFLRDKKASGREFEEALEAFRAAVESLKRSASNIKI